MTSKPRFAAGKVEGTKLYAVWDSERENSASYPMSRAEAMRIAKAFNAETEATRTAEAERKAELAARQMGREWPGFEQ